jgi:hypothetical protein
MDEVILSKSVTLAYQECLTCAVAFAIPKTMVDQAATWGGFFCCPNGHSQGWEKRNSKSENDKLRDEVAQLQSNVKYKQEQIEAERKRTIAAKAEKTKLENRIKNGVCPCCQRSFINMRRHIATKHPEFTKAK